MPKLEIPALSRTRTPLDDLLRIAETIERFDRDHPLFEVLARASEVCLEDYQCFVKQAHVVKMERTEPTDTYLGAWG